MRLQPSDQLPGVSEVLQSGARLFKDSLPRCLPLALLAVVVGQLPSAYDALRGEAATLASPKDAAWWAIVVASGLVNLWLWNLLMLVQRAFVRGDATALRAFAVEALRRVLPVLGLLACSLALIGLGLVLLVLPGIYLLVALCAAYPVLLEGRLSVPGAIDHALQLVRGHWWRSAGVLAAALFAILIFYSAGHLCGIMLARLASTATVVGQQGLVSVVSALVGCLFMPFVTALGQTHHAALEQSLALSRLPPGALPGAPGAAAR